MKLKWLSNQLNQNRFRTLKLRQDTSEYTAQIIRAYYCRWNN